jgi:hypothetical protein
VVFFVDMSITYEVEYKETACVAEGDPNAASIGITLVTLDRIMKLPKWTDALALYCFYLKTARRQHTTVIKCTATFVAKATGWSVRKVGMIKSLLIEAQLIEPIVRMGNEPGHGNIIKHHFVRVKYIVNTEKALEAKNDNQRILPPNA